MSGVFGGTGVLNFGSRPSSAIRLRLFVGVEAPFPPKKQGGDLWYLWYWQTGTWQKGARQERLEAEIEADYLVAGFAKLLELPLSFHKTHRMGEVMNRISRGATWLHSLVGRLFIDLLPQFLSIVFAFIIVFAVEWRLGFVLLASIILYATLLSRTAPKLGGVSRRMHRAYNEA